MKKTCIFVLMLILVLGVVFAADTKWEYMVVSFGATSFSQLYSKTMAYWDEGIDMTAMGGSIERELDILGQHGWEVVSIVGTIGGDQQVTLKREVDPKRTTDELTEILENSALMIESQEKILAEAAAAAAANKKTEPKIEIVDLDAKEAEEAKLANRKKMENAITEFINGRKVKPYDITFTWSETSKDEEVTIRLYYDVTNDYLIKGTNTYRRSNVISHLTELGKELSDMPWIAYVGYCYLYGNITYEGKKFDAGKVSYYRNYKGTWTLSSSY